MSVSAIGAVGFVPPVIEPRPLNVEAGDGRTDDVAGGRTNESDGSRRVVLARGGESRSDSEGEERDRPDTQAGTEREAVGAPTPFGPQSTERGGREDGEGSERGPGAEDEDEVEQGELTTEQEQVVREMKARDAEVRAHEMAHVAAGGAHVTSGPTYSYQSGPDGRRYAVGGEVGIDTSPEDDPQATIMKMMQVRAAALAPAEPSGADRAVAASAAQTAAQARAELAQERMEGAEGDEDRTAATGGSADSSDEGGSGGSTIATGGSADSSGEGGSGGSTIAAVELGVSSGEGGSDASTIAAAQSEPTTGGDAPAGEPLAPAASAAPETTAGPQDQTGGGFIDRVRARYETSGEEPQPSSVVAIA